MIDLLHANCQEQVNPRHHNTTTTNTSITNISISVLINGHFPGQPTPAGSLRFLPPLVLEENLRE